VPGVAAGASFVGTFDQEHAVEDETIDFFASGHPLVEGLLAHFEDEPKGRVARLQLELPGDGGRGIIAVWKEGPHFELVALDSDGRERPRWAEALCRRGAGVGRMPAEAVSGFDWGAMSARLVAELPARPLQAIAAVLVRGGGPDHYNGGWRRRSKKGP